MSQNNKPLSSENGRNVVSNLPLLFASGYPTSLEKITQEQLENFIPFMVQCSLGYLQIQNKSDYKEPEWWPEDIQFKIPLVKPDNYHGNWFEKLKDIVLICYSFHKSQFLLRFCKDLTNFNPESFRFINNYNLTTSLFHRTSKKLLVTFRNENMLYDQKLISNRKYLLPRTNSSQSINNHNEQMVEPSLFDIYLCDNCDAELYSLDAYLEHEKQCQSDDDVIFCKLIPPADPLSSDNIKNNDIEMMNFLKNNFNLQSNKMPLNKQLLPSHHTSNNVPDNKNEKKIAALNNKLRRWATRRSRGSNLSLCKKQTIPITSPAGLLLLKSSRSLINDEYINEKFERQERYCAAPTIENDCNSFIINLPKWFDSKSKFNHNLPITYKKPPDLQLSNINHTYNIDNNKIFQLSRYRHFGRKNRQKENIKFLNQLLLKSCRPFSIRLKKLTDYEIGLWLNKREFNNDDKIVKKRRIDTNCTDIIDYIDLCSDEENETKKNMNNNNTNCFTMEQSIIVDTAKATTVTTTMNQISTQPLGPSIILFSNSNTYFPITIKTTNATIPISSSTSSTLLTITKDDNMKMNEQNQENLVNSNHNKKKLVNLYNSHNNNSNNNASLISNRDYNTIRGRKELNHNIVAKTSTNSTVTANLTI